jgi:hypothetical protein
MAAYKRNDSQKLFDHVAMLQGSTLLVVSEWSQMKSGGEPGFSSLHGIRLIYAD